MTFKYCSPKRLEYMKGDTVRKAGQLAAERAIYFHSRNKWDHKIIRRVTLVTD